METIDYNHEQKVYGLVSEYSFRQF